MQAQVANRLGSSLARNDLIMPTHFTQLSLQTQYGNAKKEVDLSRASVLRRLQSHLPGVQLVDLQRMVIPLNPDANHWVRPPRPPSALHA